MKTYSSQTTKHIASHVAHNNRKLHDHFIFNLGSATDCPSAARGLCPIPAGQCYCLKAERMYPDCLPYRKHQTDIWFTQPASRIADAIAEKWWLSHSRPQYLRFNESGDLWTQDCIHKMHTIAADVYQQTHGLLCSYVYTARSDLDYDFPHSYLIINGSGFHKPGINNEIRVFKDVPDNPNPICPGNCGACTLCARQTGIINIKLH